VLRQGHGERVMVPHANFTYVALDDAGRPQLLAAAAAASAT
jgi:acyl-CoA hydrolase